MILKVTLFFDFDAAELAGAESLAASALIKK